MFGNPAKLNFLSSNSRWLCDLRSREVCHLSIRFKEKRAACGPGTFKESVQGEHPAFGHMVPTRYRDYITPITMSTGIFHCLTVQAVRDILGRLGREWF